MATSKLNIKIDVLDKSSKKLKALDGKLANLSKTMKKVSIASGLAFGGMLLGIKKVVGAYQIQEKAETRLASIAKTVTKATEEQIQALKNQASALQKTGVVADDVTMAGQSQLLSFALTTEETMKLTKSLGNLLVANKGVNATQEDAVTSANALGKAVSSGLLGPLQLSGIVLTDQQKALFEVANQTDRVAILTDVLADNYGSLNEDMRNTALGGMTALTMSMGDLQESIGKIISEALQPIVEKLIPVVNSILEWVEANPQLTGTIIGVTVALTALVAVVSTISILLLALNPVSLTIIAVMAGIGLAIIGISAILSKFGLTWSDVWDGIKAVTIVVVNSIMTMLESYINFWVSSINVLIRTYNRFAELINKNPIDPLKNISFDRVGLSLQESLIKHSSNITVNPQSLNNQALTSGKDLHGRPNISINVQDNNIVGGGTEAGEELGNQLMSTLQLNTAI
jgi:hypothetical protein